MELFQAVEVFTQVITYAMIASGVPPCISMLRSHNEHGMPYVFFVANFVNGMLGLGYGNLLDNITFIQINAISTAFNVFYILSYIGMLGLGYGNLLDNITFIQINAISTAFNVFYILSYMYVCRRKSKELRSAVYLLLGSFVILACVYMYLTRLVVADQLLDKVGSVLLVWTTILLLTPLLQVKQCIDDRSAASVSMTMLIAGGLCSWAWLVYGYMLKDFYVYGPNIVGISTNACIWVSVAVYGVNTAINSKKRD